MRIAVFGAGYVGCVSGACYAELGHSVILVDVDRRKVADIANGRAPIVEPGLAELVEKHAATGQLSATDSAAKALRDSELCLICVGTPSKANGNIDLTYIVRVCEQIGQALKSAAAFGTRKHTIVIRSTMLPGTVDTVVVPTLESRSGLAAGTDFHIAILPEFMRESTAITDFLSPSMLLYGVGDDESLAKLRQLNKGLPGNEVVTSVEAAEAIKYANNAWHATKITFANEIGGICKAAGVDSHEVMRVLCEDTKLNISAAYMRPGFAFGGSCLPKDLRALCYKANSLDVCTPLLSATLQSNELQIRTVLNMVQDIGHRRVGMLGLAFKSETDDLRESPLVELAEQMYGKGYQLKIYDRNVRLPKLTGSNLSFVSSRLQHLSGLIANEIDEVIDHGDTIIVGNGDRKFTNAVSSARPNQHIIDLVRISPELRSNDNYSGIAW